MTKTIWITGASSGIGAATARRAHADGHHVIISARREELLHELRDSTDDPARVSVVRLDVTDAATLEPTVSRVWREHGGVDIMVHNAGISQRGIVEETGIEVDRRVMEVNYFGVVGLTKALLPRMLERGSGHFTVVSSVAGYIGTPQRSSYCASKHALHGFFNSLRAEVHDAGIGVTLVCPGYVDTEITVHALQGDGSEMGTRSAKQQAGISADAVAQKLLTATERNRAEIYVGGAELAGIFVQRLSPTLAAQLVRRIETT